jgi:hypothetical protein
VGVCSKLKNKSVRWRERERNRQTDRQTESEDERTTSVGYLFSCLSFKKLKTENDENYIIIVSVKNAEGKNEM